MTAVLRHIIIVLASSMALLSLHSCKEEGVIDENSMAKIYAEMLLTDQWINSTPGMRLIADTSLVYEPILKKYGYTSEDYRKSVEHYLNDPDTYADIMKMTVRILDGKLVDLNKRKVEIGEGKERDKFIKTMSREIKLNDSLFAINHVHEDVFGPDDSLSVEWDTLSLCFNIRRVQKTVKADSLTVADSVAAVDSIAVADTSLIPLKVSDRTRRELNRNSIDLSDTPFIKRNK